MRQPDARSIQFGAQQDLEERGLHSPLVPKVNSNAKRLSVIVRKPDFVVTWLLPFVVFSILTVLFTYSFMQLPSLCVLLASLFASLGAVLVCLGSRRHIWFPLGATTLAASLLGTLLGLYIYETFACYPRFYANSRIYTNVVPSQPSAAVADAGGVTFSSDTIVNTTQSSGFMSEAGYIYCVAPVEDKVGGGGRGVQFWAVGVDCCGAAGDFECDQARDAGVRAGIRVFDNSGWFMYSNKDFYQLARLKAEATYGLVSVAEPMYLRWVQEDRLDMLSHYYSLQAALAVIGVVVLYLIFAAVLALALYRPRTQPGKPKPQL